MMRRYSTLFVTGVVVLAALFASACTGESKSASVSPTAATPKVGASPAATTAASSATAPASGATRDLVAGQLAALSIVDAAGYHAMDEAMNGGDRKVNPQWLGKVRNGQIAVAAVAWPTELSAQAKAFTEAAEKLAAAIEADNATNAAPAAKANHDAWHKLTTNAWALLAKNAGVKVASHAEGTATPSSTPGR